MNKTSVATIISLFILTGCGGSDVPSECTDIIESTIEMAEKSGQSMGNHADDAMKKLESDWEKMTDDQKEKTKNQCIQAKKMFDMIK